MSLLSGAFGALVLPALSAIMVEDGRNYGLGFAMSLFNMSMSLGLVIGPMMAGCVADTLGLNFVFYFFSIVGIFGISFFAVNYKRS